MRALSIRQPYAELILRGVKTIEYRSRPTRIIGERFYLYASKTWASGGAAKPWSLDLAPVEGSRKAPPPWMLELAKALILRGPDGGPLPTGMIVGSAVIEKVTPGDAADGTSGLFCWHLGSVERVKTLRKPKGHPQPVWFEPF